MNIGQMLSFGPTIRARKHVAPLTAEQLAKEVETGERICTTCEKPRPLSDFYLRTGSKTKRVRICNQCEIDKVVSSRRNDKLFF